MMSYLILFALIALVIYYGHGAYRIVKNFIDKKRAEKLADEAASHEIELSVLGEIHEEEQTHGE